jgi:glycosyltransferase involved in cell wall biosynthesis
LWESDENRLRLSAQGIAHAANFTWERTARMTLDVYEEILRGAAGERRMLEEAGGERPV